jgi:cytochrome c biogenesis protein CcmG/thiol:disulfide interchange protein DsbE
MIQDSSPQAEEQPLATASQPGRQHTAVQPAKFRITRGGNHRRTITMMVLAGILLLAGIFLWLTLLPSPAPAPIAGVPVGTVAPLPMYGGGGSGSIDLLALRGHPTVINFWSESCIPCRTEMPLLEQTSLRYGAQGAFALLGVNQADPQDDIAPFGRQFHITYPLLFDPEGRVNQDYKVTAIPTTYFLDRTGVVRAAFVTQLTPKTIRQGLASVGIIIP